MAEYIPTGLRQRPVLVSQAPANTPEEAAMTAGGGAIKRGIRGAAAGLRAGSLARDELDALIEKEYGKAASIAIEREKAQRAGAAYGPRVSSLKDIDGAGDALEFAGGALGQGLVTTLPAAAGAIGSALALRRGRGAALLPNAVRSRVATLPANLQRYAKGLIGAPGASAASVPMEAGETANELLNDPEAMKNMTPRELQTLATRKGLAASLPEALAPSLALGKIINSRAGRRTLRGTLADAAGTVGTEGATEGVQNLIGQTALRQANPNRPFDLQSTLDEAVSGAIGGGGLALPGAAIDAGAAIRDRSSDQVVRAREAVEDTGRKVVDTVTGAPAKVVDTVTGAPAKAVDLAKTALGGAKQRAVAKQDVLSRLADQPVDDSYNIAERRKSIAAAERAYLSDEVPPDLEIDTQALSTMTPDEQVAYLDDNDRKREVYTRQRFFERLDFATTSLRQLLDTKEGVDPKRKARARELLDTLEGDPSRQNAIRAVEEIIDWGRRDVIKDQFRRIGDKAKGAAKKFTSAAKRKGKKTRSSEQGETTPAFTPPEPVERIADDKSTIELVRDVLTKGSEIENAPGPNTDASRAIAQFFQKQFPADTAKQILNEFVSIYGENAPGVAANVAEIIARNNPNVDADAIGKAVLDHMEQRVSGLEKRYALVRSALTNDARLRLQKITESDSARDPIKEVRDLAAKVAGRELEGNQMQQAKRMLMTMLGDRYSETISQFENMLNAEANNAAVFVGPESSADKDAGASGFEQRAYEKNRHISEVKYKTKRDGKIEVFDKAFPDHKRDAIEKLKASNPRDKVETIPLSQYVKEHDLDPVAVAKAVSKGAEEAGLVIEDETTAQNVLKTKSVLQITPFTDYVVDLEITQDEMKALKLEPTSYDKKTKTKYKKRGAGGFIMFTDSNGKEFAVSAGKLLFQTRRKLYDNASTAKDTDETTLLAGIVSVLNAPGVNRDIMPYVYKADGTKQEFTNKLPGALRLHPKQDNEATKRNKAATDRKELRKADDEQKITSEDRLNADRDRREREDKWLGRAEKIDPANETAVFKLLDRIQKHINKTRKAPYNSITAADIASSRKMLDAVAKRLERRLKNQLEADPKYGEVPNNPTIDADYEQNELRKFNRATNQALKPAEYARYFGDGAAVKRLLSAMREAGRIKQIGTPRRSILDISEVRKQERQRKYELRRARAAESKKVERRKVVSKEEARAAAKKIEAIVAKRKAKQEQQNRKVLNAKVLGGSIGAQKHLLEFLEESVAKDRTRSSAQGEGSVSGENTSRALDSAAKELAGKLATKRLHRVNGKTTSIFRIVRDQLQAYMDAQKIPAPNQKAGRFLTAAYRQKVLRDKITDNLTKLSVDGASPMLNVAYRAKILKVVLAKGQEILDAANTRSSTQNGPVPGEDTRRPSTAEERAAAEAYIRKVLGPKVVLEWIQDFGQSGMWVEDGAINEATGEVRNLIYLSTSPSAGVMSVAAHEAMHDMFSRLLKTEDQKTIDVLMKAANSPVVVAQLNRLLRGEGNRAAREQIADGAEHAAEERLSYMFQFWTSGDLKIGPKTETVFQKIVAFLRKISGFVHNDTQALHIMQALHDGQLSTPGPAAAVLTELHREKGLAAVQKKIQPLLDKGKELAYSADGDLRTSGNKYLEQIADLFNTPGTSTEEGSGYLNAKPKQIAHWLNRLNNVISDLSPEDLEILHKSLQTNKLPGYPAADRAFYAIREMLSAPRTGGTTDRSFWRYMRDAGMSVKRRSNYYPVVWDSENIASNAARFKELLLQHHRQELMGIAANAAERENKRREIAHAAENIDRIGGGTDFERVTVSIQEVADTIVTTIINERGSMENTPNENNFRVGYTPRTQAIYARKLDFLDREVFSEFERKDLVSTLSTYLVQGVKHAEYARRFGVGTRQSNQNVVLNNLLAMAENMEFDKHGREKGEANMIRYRKAIMAMEGTLGTDMSPRMRQLSSAMLAYQNLRLLPLSLFASLVDPMGVIVRGGTMKAGYDTFKRGVREVVASYTKAGKVDDEAAKLAERLGTVDNAIFLDTLGETYSSIYMTGMAKKINDKLFKYNGMEGWNRGVRIAATQTAIDFIKAHATTPGEHSVRWLKELGITSADVQINDDGSLKMFEEDGLTVEQMEKIQTAVSRFVDSSVLRPNAAQRPAWASDPRYALLFHLKQFTYTFQKVILSRVASEWKHGNPNAVFALAAYVPFMIAADIIKGMLTSGGDEPDYKKGWGVSDYIINGVERSAILGTGQFGVDVYNYGLQGLSGPTAEQAISLITDPADRWLVRSLPANAVYREALR